MAMQQEPKKLEMPTRPSGKIPRYGTSILGCWKSYGFPEHHVSPSNINDGTDGDVRYG